MINYYLLIKPGIIFGNLVTFAAGYFLASKGLFSPVLFISTLLGLALVIASACVFNNMIDRFADKKMERTKKRPIPSGAIGLAPAFLFACVLFLIGNGLLFYFTNWITLFVTNIGFFVYVLPYSFLKEKTTYSTLIGSVAGAVPPVVGYLAVSNRFDLGALLLFLVLVLWQMPHFFAISLWHLEDYTKAELPILPVAKGIERTKVHMVLYILALIPAISLLTFFGYTGYLFLVITGVVGLAWLALSCMGFRAKDNALWGKQMFRLSLVLINVISILMIFDPVAH